MNTPTPLHFQTQGDGKHLVFIHGWGMPSIVWQPLMTNLAKRYRITLIDLPGYGNSAPMNADYTLENLVASIINTIPEKATWIGWSLGGLIATAIADQYPENTNAIVNVTSSPKFLDDADWPGVKMGLLDNFANLMVDDFQSTIRRFLALQFLGVESANELLHSLNELFAETPPTDPEALFASLELLRSADLRNTVKRITCPMHYIFGKLDALIPIGAAQCIEQLSPQVSTHIITKAGHAPFLSHQAQFTNALELFLHEYA